MKFFIEDISRKKGGTRTDGKYPNRIGSTIEFIDAVKIGEPAMFQYITYNNGQLAQNHVTQTSRVDDLEWYKDKFYIYTRHNIYTLKPLD